MSYVISSTKKWEDQDGNERTHKSYFIKIGKRMPFPTFGGKGGAMRFVSKKQAREKLAEMGRKEGDKYKIEELESENQRSQ